MATTPTTGNGPIDYVRKRLSTMGSKEITRLAADADIAMRSVYNIRDGGNARYNTVMTLHGLLKKQRATPAKRSAK